MKSKSKEYLKNFDLENNNLYNSVFFKVKNGNEFLLRFKTLILSFLAHLKYQEEYKKIKKAKIEIMKIVNKNYSIIYSLLEQLYTNLPVKNEELSKLRYKEKGERSEKLKQIKKEEKEIKKELSELEKLKKEVEELELQVLKLINEK